MTEEAVLAADSGASAAPRINTLAVFARTLVLAFEHPLRLLITGTVPAALITLFVGNALYAMPLIDQNWVTDSLWLTGIPAIVLTVFWGCAWQRAVARKPAEPMLAWLGRSLRQWPRYALAAALAILLPALICLFFFGMTYLIMAGGRLDGFAGGWWYLAFVFVLLLPGLWLFARLSLLPAVVAVDGWSGAAEHARALGRGRNFGLTLAFAFFLLIGFILSGLASFVFYRLLMATIMMGDSPLDSLNGVRLSYLIGQTVVISLLGSWILGLPALVLRQETRADEIDPNAFD